MTCYPKDTVILLFFELVHPHDTVRVLVSKAEDKSGGC